MKEYLRVRGKAEKTSTWVGLGTAVLVHLAAILFCSFTGLSYLYPPPEENTFLMDFSQVEEEDTPMRYGTQPRGENPDLDRPIELVQRAESPVQAPVSQNLSPASRPDDFGDVDVPAPNKEPELDQRSLFPGMAPQDTSVQAPHSAREASNTYNAGQPDGNTSKGNTAGTPNVHLKGRSVVGNLPRPTYNVQREGKVVVAITVDQYGKVTQAVPGADGTTVTDQTLWAAARKAAMESHFNQTNDPVPSQGTITYEFKLK
ncbi:MAG: energy transducer TonB [Bacteroidales bacterium]|nr:energy transducer TonB [Bacteroidales bacterium]